MNVLAVDPGPEQSAYARIDAACRPVEVGILPNEELRAELHRLSAGAHTAIEWISSYGMPVGVEVFDTCLWVGCFSEYLRLMGHPTTPQLIKRGEVKLHLCHTARAKDGNVTQALVDRFAPGQPNKGKGTKTAPGWFYGFHDDIWQAYALAVYLADIKAGALVAG